jgi:hypothetical protein
MGMEMKHPRRTVSIILLLMLVAGCTMTPASPLLIEYRRTGGIAGFDDQLTIFENGTATLTRRGGQEVRFILTDAELRNLSGLLQAAGFSDLDPEYPPAQPGADYFDYRITYQGKTVHAVDTGIPVRLEPVLRALNTIVGEHASP